MTTQSKATKIMWEMREALKSLGLNLYNAETPTRLTNRDELHTHSRHSNHDEHPLLGLAQWSTTYVGKRIVSRQFNEILIQTNLPEDHFRTVVIHELTHAWFFYNNPKGEKLPLHIEEGMCVLVEYLWLKKQKTDDAQYRMTIIKECPDPIYGDGFRAALKAMNFMRLSSLARYIIEKKKFPSAFSAFFYE
ncbi:protein DA1 [Sansalvadorimonas verongulae]|uniref:protein DA1 n=1 Tax=Sansalvadorimonas verongulae TaxID=2172824 RepID=UPI002E3552DA|nr:protein DA1 [Sansalvadorimonas verongulae]